ncbi:hypothetical protein OF820_01740 [Oceanotoga sp. DSM 15011]|uniref:Flagellar assembly protein FliH n=1 Tax=Oceanotoga teriensis TaxID=515440 RepID=A0AA45C5H0_9BACT|nr:MULTISPECIES: hypothetical protein [Oceanotoga]MDN5342306.1 flagellar assembly protein FliH [Oceanotoga sp.]MDO7977369.1 hypothetical protein [Oceanotoga teriensis]PWJ88759.1 flagellar assembly protein FliH [Oceanotoga teriensis]UYP00414.1 hypothetical protein OF820_01740 [Oceanotoga sp. DSM 15011]
MYNKKIIDNKYVVLDTPINIEDKDKINKINENNKSLILEKEIEIKLKDAEKKSETLIEEAISKSKKILEEARIKAENESKKIHEESLKEIENLKLKEVDNFKEKLQKNLDELDHYYDDLISSSNYFIFEVIKTVTKKYLNEEIFNKPIWLNEAISRLKNRLTTYSKVKIRMNSNMNEKYYEIFKELLSDSFTIKEDNSLEDNQIIADTESGIFDINPEMYIEEIMNSLEESINEEN